LPLLEETGYIPKHRYSSGEEIRTYAELVAKKYNVDTSAVFLTTAKRLQWNEAAKEWDVELEQRQGESQTLNIRAQFVAMINGVLNRPKLPNIPGISNFHGESFHAARWNYAATGGSPDDSSLDKLKEKRVAIVGTACTAVQLVPEVARWARHLYVVQRTPSSVDVRGQRETDPEWFQSEVATSKGWQRKRSRNFHQHFSTADLPSSNLVNDEWTRAQGMVPIAGNPDPTGPKTPADLPAYMQRLQALDLPRQTRIRARVDHVGMCLSFGEIP
jgi:cation diffusion facilitator CzcD-associated flavoprotein CzcO